MAKVRISEHKLRKHFRHDAFTRLSQIQSSCSSSRQFKFDFALGRIVCLGPDQKYEMGLVQCRSFFNCVDKALEALTIYLHETDKCRVMYGKSNESQMEYDINNQWPLIELLRKKSAVSTFPRHFLVQCADRLPTVITTRAGNMGDYIYCRRLTTQILQSLEILKTCHEFVARCRKIFDCLESRSPCVSSQFGIETADGFLLGSYDDANWLLDPRELLNLPRSALRPS